MKNFNWLLLVIILSIVTIGGVGLRNKYVGEINELRQQYDSLGVELKGVQAERQKLASLLNTQEQLTDSLENQLTETKKQLGDIYNKYADLKNDLEGFSPDEHIEFFKGITFSEYSGDIVDIGDYPKSVVLEGENLVLVAQWQVETSNYLFVELFEKRAVVLKQKEIISEYEGLVASLKGEIEIKDLIIDNEKRQNSLLLEQQGVLKKENDTLTQENKEKSKGILIRNIIIGVVTVIAVVL